MRLSQPQQLMAAEREIVDEAYAGDVIGVFDPGIFSIRDTITVPGKKFKILRHPHLCPPSISAGCPPGLHEAQAVRQGYRADRPRRAPFRFSRFPAQALRRSSWVSWVRCNLTCFQYRMKNEYGVDLRGWICALRGDRSTNTPRPVRPESRLRRGAGGIAAAILQLLGDRLHLPPQPRSESLGDRGGRG